MVKFWTYTLKAAIALLGLAGLPFLIKGLPLIYDELMLIYPEYAHLWPLCIGLLAAMAAPLYAAAGAWWFLSVCNKTWVFGSQQNKPLTLVALCAAADLVLGLVLFLILAFHAVDRGSNPLGDAKNFNRLHAFWLSEITGLQISGYNFPHEPKVRGENFFQAGYPLPDQSHCCRGRS